MTIDYKKLYHFLLKENTCHSVRTKCIQLNQVRCNTEGCSSCPCYTDPAEAKKLINQLIETVKSRDPELYFVDELSELNNLLKQIGGSNGPSE